MIVVDQFEEVFTLCTDEVEREKFIEQLLSVSQQQKVVITMRADFWGECAPYPDFSQRFKRIAKNAYVISCPAN